MVTHNLMLRLKDRSPETIAKAQDTLLSMRGKVEVLRDLRVDTDTRRAATSYDLLLVARFASRADFEAYLVHPFHVEVAKYVQSVLDTMAGVLYED